MTEELPQYLYHYTTIESLALILKNRTIRFNSLANVDDLEEQMSLDLGNYGKLCFTSCWTDNPRENIALWNIYSKNGTGVRIKLPTNPFKYYVIELKGENAVNMKSLHRNITINNGENCVTYVFDPIDCVNLFKVIYTKNEQLRKPPILEQSDDKKNTKINSQFLGMIKSDIWSFQDEWRYSFSIFPASLPILSIGGYSIDQIKQFCENIVPPFDYYDLSIDDKYFNNMEIMMGPSTREAERVIVDSLVKTYTDDVKICISDLKNSVRFKNR